MMDETLNSIAGILALTGAVPILGAALTYGFGSPWWRSWLGRVMFGLFLALVLAFIVILGRRTFGDYPGYGLVALIAYGYITLALWATWAIILVERRNPAPPTTERKASTMSNVPITTEAVPSIWYKAQRVIRTVLAVIVAIITTAGSTLAIIAVVAPQILAELEPLLAPEVFGWLAGWVAALIVLSGVITRIMAIPAVNAFLTKFGAGSVPASAIIDAGVVAVDKSAVITSLPANN